MCPRERVYPSTLWLKTAIENHGKMKSERGATARYTQTTAVMTGPLWDPVQDPSFRPTVVLQADNDKGQGLGLGTSKIGGAMIEQRTERKRSLTLIS